MDIDRAEDYEVCWTGVQAHTEAVRHQRQAEPRVAPGVCHVRRQGHLRAVLAVVRRAGDVGCTMAEVMRACDLSDRRASCILCRLCDGGELRRLYAKWRGHSTRAVPQIFVATVLASGEGGR